MASSVSVSKLVHLSPAGAKPRPDPNKLTEKVVPLQLWHPDTAHRLAEDALEGGQGASEGSTSSSKGSKTVHILLDMWPRWPLTLLCRGCAGGGPGRLRGFHEQQQRQQGPNQACVFCLSCAPTWL